MAWSDVGSWLKSNAGTGTALVGSLLTGNVPGAVAAGVALVSSATGHSDPVKALEQLQTNPETLLKLRELAQKNEESIRGHLAEMYRLELGDFKSARDRDTGLRKAGYKNNRADIMIAIAFASLIIIFVLINTNDAMKAEVLAICNMAIGTILKMLSDAFQFEFGSSRGSKEKDFK
jgi:hypothetical protein